MAMAAGPPIPNPDCAPVALLVEAVSSVADLRRHAWKSAPGCWMAGRGNQEGVRIDDCSIHVAWDGSIDVG